METRIEVQPLFEDRDKDINGDGDPDLRLHGVFGGSIECFDSEMLLDPFEEQFDFPSATIKFCDGECGQDGNRFVDGILGSLHESALIVRHLGRSVNIKPPAAIGGGGAARAIHPLVDRRCSRRSRR